MTTQSGGDQTVKILVLCMEGNNRSQTIAQTLRYYRKAEGYEFDVLAAGLGTSQPSTLIMLLDWADKIILVQAEYALSIPKIFDPKVVVWDVGPDVYPRPHNKALLNKVHGLIAENAQSLLSSTH